MPAVPRPRASRGACKDGGRRCGRVCRREAALTLNSSPGACVCVCVSTRVSARDSGLEAAAKLGPRGAEPRARSEAIHDFGDVIPGVGREGGASRGRAPPPAPINTAARALCGAASSVENPEPRLLRQRPAACPPTCRSRDILTRGAVTVSKSQGRGSASPRTSCLCISPFTGEYPAPLAGHPPVSRPWLAGTPRLLVCRVRGEGGRGRAPRAPRRSQRQGCKGGGCGRGTVVLRASRQRK